MRKPRDRTESAALPHDHTRQLQALTGIRAFAAMWVVVYHFQAQVYAVFPGLRHVSPLIESGYLGVDLFFSLSGFILAYNYLHRLGNRWSLRGHGQFLWLRLARVYPVHFFTLNVFALMLTVGTLAGFAMRSQGLRVNSGAYVENLFLVQVWVGQAFSFNGPAWSVSAEWFAYLLFPLLAPAIFRLRSAKSALVAAGACYGLLILVWVTVYWGSAGGTSGALLRVELEFLGGCFLFLIWDRTRGRSWTAITWVSLVAIFAGAWAVSPLHYKGVVLAPLFGLLILSIAKSDRAPLSRLLSTKVAVFGGEVSYALYMTHGLVQPVARRLLPPATLAGHGFGVRLAAGVALIALVVVPAAFVYYAVEVPARLRMRRMMNRGAVSSRRSRT